MIACGHLSSSFSMLPSYCPLLVEQRRCRLKPHKVSVSEIRSSRGSTELTDREGPQRRDWRPHRKEGEKLEEQTHSFTHSDKRCRSCCHVSWQTEGCRWTLTVSDLPYLIHVLVQTSKSSKIKNQKSFQKIVNAELLIRGCNRFINRFFFSYTLKQNNL